MGNSEAKPFHREYGPWRGVNEWPGEAGPGEVEAAWNVEFRGNVVRTRNGRRLLGSLNLGVPSRVLFWHVTDTGPLSVVDITGKVTDGDVTTTGGVALVATDELWVGLPFAVSGLRITIGVANTAAVTLTAKYLAASGLTALAGVTDGTLSAGKTLAQSGDITFTVPTDWKSAPAPYGGGGPALYWIQLTAGGGGISAGTTIAEMKIVLPSTTLKGINGAYHWQRRDGRRLLVVGMDDKDAGQPRLFAYDRFKQILTPFNLPLDAARTGQDAQWVFAAVNDSLIAANGYCFFYSDPDDPFTMRAFKPAILKSAANRGAGAPSQVIYLTVFQDQLVIVDRNSPNTVQLSDPVGAVFDLEAGNDAPLGGMHIWDPTNTFDCVDPHGGKITGLVPISQQLIIFTPRSTHSWDGFAHRVTDPAVGCIAPKSITSDQHVVIFLGPDGVYEHGANGNALVSWKIDLTIRSLDRFSLHTAVACIQREKKLYRLWVPSGEKGRNTLGLIYDYRDGHRFWHGKYGIPPWVDGQSSNMPMVGDQPVPYEIAAFAVIRDDDWGEEILSFDYSGRIWEEDVGWLDDNSAIPYPPPWGVISARIKWEMQAPMTVRRVYVEAQTEGFTPAPTTSTLSGGILVGLIRDGYVPSFFGEDAVKKVGLRESKVGVQTYAEIFLGRDNWLARRFDSFRADFGAEPRYGQVMLFGGNYVDGSGSGGAPYAVIRGWEVEIDVHEEPR